MRIFKITFCINTDFHIRKSAMILQSSVKYISFRYQITDEILVHWHLQDFFHE